MEFVGGLLLIVIGATLIGGATVLWIKTCRATALLQLIASFVVFVACTTQAFALCLVALDHNTFWDTLRTSRADVVLNVVLVLGVLLFSFSYLLYALRHKRI